MEWLQMITYILFLNPLSNKQLIIKPFLLKLMPLTSLHDNVPIVIPYVPKRYHMIQKNYL